MKSLSPEVRADLLEQVREIESKKVTPRHHHDVLAWPGETVLSHIHEEDPAKKGFEFVVKKVIAGVDTVIDPKEAHLLPHGIPYGIDPSDLFPSIFRNSEESRG